MYFMFIINCILITIYHQIMISRDDYQIFNTGNSCTNGAYTKTLATLLHMSIYYKCDLSIPIIYNSNIKNTEHKFHVLSVGWMETANLGITSS